MENINKLVEKIKSDDKKAFEELYRITASELYWYCMRLCGNGSDAEDLLQEVYFNAWKKIGQYSGTNFKAWLHSIAHNLWLNTLKKRKNTEIFLEDEFAEIPEAEELSPENQSELKINHDEVMRIIDESLNDAQRMAVLMYYYDEKSISEIAAETECTENAVKCRLRRAREKLCSEFKCKDISLPMLLRIDAEKADFSDTLDILGKNIAHRTAASSMQIPCIISIFSAAAVVGVTFAVSDIIPSENKAIDNSVLNVIDSSETENSRTESAESIISETIGDIEDEILIYTDEEIFSESENNNTEVADMNKTMNTIISSAVSASIAVSGTMLTASAEITDESMAVIESTETAEQTNNSNITVSENGYYILTDWSVYDYAPYDPSEVQDYRLFYSHTQADVYAMLYMDDVLEFLKASDNIHMLNENCGLATIMLAGVDKINGKAVLSSEEVGNLEGFDEKGNPVVSDECVRTADVKLLGFVDGEEIWVGGMDSTYMIKFENGEPVGIIDNQYESVSDYEIYRITDVNTGEKQLIKVVGGGKYEVIARGDATLDCNVDIRDVSKYAQHIVKVDTIPDYADIIADIDDDGSIDIKDLMSLKSYLIGDKEEL